MLPECKHQYRHHIGMHLTDLKGVLKSLDVHRQILIQLHLKIADLGFPLANLSAQQTLLCLHEHQPQ